MKIKQIFLAASLTFLFFSCEKQSQDDANGQVSDLQEQLMETNIQFTDGELTSKNLSAPAARKDEVLVPLVKEISETTTNEDGSVIETVTTYIYDKDNFLVQTVLEDGEVTVSTSFTYDDFNRLPERLVKKTVSSNAPEEDQGVRGEGITEYIYNGDDALESLTSISVDGIETTQTFEGSSRSGLVQSQGATTFDGKSSSFTEDYLFRFGFVTSTNRKDNDGGTAVEDFFHTFEVGNPLELATTDPVKPEAIAYNFGSRETLDLDGGTLEILFIALDGTIDQDGYPIEINFKRDTSAFILDGEEVDPASTEMITKRYTYYE